jgi:signal transduction histidine kinase
MRERVRQFQGTINIESNGRGTTILVSLPLPITSTTKPQDMTQDTGVPG